ncbi:sentrin-specific protease 5 [Hypanus sabinus]|uniref:sentrin-specific protease 5 n=1 Tax=Hypanus sabinus TaxID=79690 RepID=UPI0028C48D94|nr:sentrin-specific protease 5 [Hypanus sabinus]XP_059799887.1 sentrin-specific protease 5 [Hypanus sabinus]
MKEHSNNKCCKRCFKANLREQLRSHHSKWNRLEGSLCLQRQLYYQQKQRLWLSIRKKRAKSVLRKDLPDCQQRGSPEHIECTSVTSKEKSLLGVNDVSAEQAHKPESLASHEEVEGNGSESWNSNTVAPDTDFKSTVLYGKPESELLTDPLTSPKSIQRKNSGLMDNITNQKLSNGYKKIDLQVGRDFVSINVPRKTKRQLKGRKISLLCKKPSSLFSFYCRIFNCKNRRRRAATLRKEKLRQTQCSGSVYVNPKRTGQHLDKMACDISSKSTAKGKESNQNMNFSSVQSGDPSENVKQVKNLCLTNCCEVSKMALDEGMDALQTQMPHFAHSVNQMPNENSEVACSRSGPHASVNQLLVPSKWPKPDGSHHSFAASQGRSLTQAPVCDGEMQVINAVTDSTPLSCNHTSVPVTETGKSVCCQSDEPCPVLQPQLLDHIYYRSSEERSGHALVRTEQPAHGQTEKGKENESRACSVASEQLISCIHAFLDEFLRKYGSLIPLTERDVLMKLEQIFHQDFRDRKVFIKMEIRKYQKAQVNKPVSSFQVVYNKHVLTLDDLATLYGENWLNDQVINMYGELIVDAVPDKVHFFNSFFYKQLQTKGYNGVKRWTKKVDLFSKSLLLIPIHLEIHWSLLTVDLPNRKICLYDSQGIHFNSCVQNILKYLKTEAGERNCPTFLEGWKAFATTCIPQQKNDSDCGVFVLQYCKCLALGRPFQFSQKDMPEVRKLIYRELCECKLME